MTHISKKWSKWTFGCFFLLVNLTSTKSCIFQHFSAVWSASLALQLSGRLSSPAWRGNMKKGCHYVWSSHVLQLIFPSPPIIISLEHEWKRVLAQPSASARFRCCSNGVLSNSFWTRPPLKQTDPSLSLRQPLVKIVQKTWYALELSQKVMKHTSR